MTEQPTSLYGDQPEAPRPQAPSLLDQVVGVFTEPKQLFANLRPRPSWWPALALIMGITLIAMLIWASKVDMAEATRLQMERSKEIFRVNIPDQVMDEAIAKAEGKRPWFSALSGALLGTPFAYLVVSLMVWAFAAMGTEEGEDSPTFAQAFSVTCVHYLVTLPSMFLAGLIALIRPVGGHNIQALIPTSLSFFMQPESMLMRGLAGMADPLWFASFYVLAIGMRHTLRTKVWATAACLAVFALFGSGFRFLGSLFQ